MSIKGRTKKFCVGRAVHLQRFARISRAYVRISVTVLFGYVESDSRYN